MSLYLTPLQDTILKRRPLQAAELPEDQKQPITKATLLELHCYTRERDHLRVSFAKDSFKGFNTWYIYVPHALISEGGTQKFPQPKPNQVKLSIPYKSQRDNEENPDGSCNVTSVAMCLEFLGFKCQSGQLEDDLYRYAEDHCLNRHDPYDLAQIVKHYGKRDHFRTNATIAQVQDWLAQGKPAITHGYFTAFGHIVVLAGYDEKGFLVHDPYGEWNSWGYDRNAPGGNNVKGKYVHYSYKLIRSLCIPDGTFWVHFIS